MSERAKVTAKAPAAKRENKASQISKPELSQSANSPIDQILFLQRTIGNQAVQRLIRQSGVNGQESTGIQAKLKIGQPNDIYEQEADRVSEQVVTMSEPAIQLKPT